MAVGQTGWTVSFVKSGWGGLGCGVGSHGRPGSRLGPSSKERRAATNQGVSRKEMAGPDRT